jgi:multidrug efflux pump subunit AcrA (membrane-fusion protein)
MKKVFLIGVFLCLFVAGWFIFGNQPVVSVTAVTRSMALDAVPAAVKVDPEFQVTITSDVAGLVRKSNLKIGQLVVEGDTLCEIDHSKYELDLAQLEKQLETTRQQFALNLDQRTALDRQRESLAVLTAKTKAGEYPELELKHRQEEFGMFIEGQTRERLGREQQIANMEHDIAMQKKNIADCSIKAPTSGTVTAIFAQPGEVIAVRAPLVRLYSKSLLVEARINEEDFSGIRPGLTASVRFLAYGPELYTAKVVKVLPNADPLNQQYRAYLEVNIAGDRLIPGLSGEASIIRNRRESSLVVSRSALFNGAVFVVKNGKVERRSVEIGFKSLTAIEILKGVVEGETVAVSGLDALQDGQKVRIGQ